MIQKEDILGIAKKFIHREQGIPDRRLMHTRREWLIIMLLSIMLCVSGGVYAFYTFTVYSAISVESEAVEVDQLHYQRVDAQAAIELYTEKKTAYEELLIVADTYMETVPSFEEETTPDTSSETVVEEPATPEVLSGTSVPEVLE